MCFSQYYTVNASKCQSFHNYSQGLLIFGNEFNKFSLCLSQRIQTEMSIFTFACNVFNYSNVNIRGRPLESICQHSARLESGKISGNKLT